MNDRELMQYALRALEASNAYDWSIVAALRERLAQPERDGACRHCGGTGCVACDARYLPEQEPVAWWLGNKTEAQVLDFAGNIEAKLKEKNA